MCAVEWKKLGDVCSFQRGSIITEKDAIPGDVPVLSGGQKPAYYHNQYNRKGETVVVAGSGAYAGFVSFWDIPVFLSDSFSVNPNDILNTKYVFYFLKNIQDKIFATKKGSGVPHVHGSSIAKFEIPIPSLAKQQEIVSHLDTFTTLISNLESELDMRRKQYEHYRNQLLDFEGVEGVEWKTLAELSLDIFSGATPSTKQSKYWQNGTIPWMSSGEVHQGIVETIEKRITQEGYDSCSTQMVPLDSIVIALAGQGKTRGCVALTKTELCTNQSLAAIVPNKILLNSEYLYYYLKSKYMELRTISAGDGTRGGLNLQMIRNYKIILPSLHEQEKIVNKLNSFANLIQSLEQEIKLRKQQYEYYREKLLTFEKE